MDRPTKDTSTYSNIGSTGNTRRFVWANTFPGEGRQSALLAMFDTEAAGIPSGVPAGRMRITRVTFTAATWFDGPQAEYDPTPDPWQSFLWPGGEINVFNENGGLIVVGTEQIGADPRYVELEPAEIDNAPIELFGARFNNGLSAETWVESAIGTPGWSGGIPNAEPIDFDEAGNERSVRQNLGETAIEFVEGEYVGDDGNTYFTLFPTGDFVDDPVDGFDPRPFAIGESVTIEPGGPNEPGFTLGGMGQTAVEPGGLQPYAHRYVFEVDVLNPAIQRYFRDQIREGWVSLILSQLAFGDLSEARYSYWITKEGTDFLPAGFDLDPSSLEIRYVVAPPGDMNADGVVALEDLSLLAVAWQNPAAYRSMFPELDAEAMRDTDGDGSVTFGDVVLAVRAIDEALRAGSGGEGGE